MIRIKEGGENCRDKFAGDNKFVFRESRDSERYVNYRYIGESHRLSSC